MAAMEDAPVLLACGVAQRDQALPATVHGLVYRLLKLCLPHTAREERDMRAAFASWNAQEITSGT